MTNSPYITFLEGQLDQPLKEFLDTSVIVQHDTLNSMFWNADQTLRKEVRARMLEIANAFLKTVATGEQPVIKDIVFAGSNANYNYSSSSDVDVHIMMDLGSFKTINQEAAKTLFNKARADYNRTRHITMRGFPVEVFVEDIDTPPPGGGIFSIMRNRWLTPPVKLSRDPSKLSVKFQVSRLASQWAKEIKISIKTQDIEHIFATFNRIREQRSAGIEREGDGSIENSAYKVLRNNRNIFDKMMGNTKLFDKMWATVDRLKDAELSMPVPDEPLNEFFFGPPGVKYNRTMHPDLWENGKLKVKVRLKMERIAEEFRRFLGMGKVSDIRFKGSMANYNYTKTSDIDLHLIARMTPQQEKFFEAKRLEWKQKYGNISIYGHPVELGVEQPNHVHTSSAVFSIKRNEWIDKPTHNPPTTDLRKADEIFRDWQTNLVDAIKSGDLKKVKEVESKIRGKRNRALPGHTDPVIRQQMELSPENVAFKRLRDTGIFDKCKELYIEDKVGDLSIEKRRGLLGILGLK